MTTSSSPVRKCALLTRVSTTMQSRVEEGSLKNQLERLRAHIAYRNSNYDERWVEIDTYEMKAVSGKDALRSKEFLRLFEDIRLKRVNVILAGSLDRVSRSVKDFQHLLEVLTKEEVELISLKETLDTSTAHGRWLVLAHPNEAAPACDLEGPLSTVNRVGDVHGRSLADPLGATAKPGRAPAASATVVRWHRVRPSRSRSSRERRLRPRVLRPDRLEPSRLRQLLLPRLPAHRPRAEGIAGFSSVSDSGMHAADRVRGVRDDAAAACPRAPLRRRLSACHDR